MYAPSSSSARSAGGPLSRNGGGSSSSNNNDEAHLAFLKGSKSNGNTNSSIHIATPNKAMLLEGKSLLDPMDPSNNASFSTASLTTAISSTRTMQSGRSTINSSSVSNANSNDASMVSLLSNGLTPTTSPVRPNKKPAAAAAPPPPTRVLTTSFETALLSNSGDNDDEGGVAPRGFTMAILETDVVDGSTAVAKKESPSSSVSSSSSSTKSKKSGSTKSLKRKRRVTSSRSSGGISRSGHENQNATAEATSDDDDGDNNDDGDSSESESDPYCSPTRKPQHLSAASFSHDDGSDSSSDSGSLSPRNLISPRRQKYRLASKRDDDEENTSNSSNDNSNNVDPNATTMIPIKHHGNNGMSTSRMEPRRRNNGSTTYETSATSSGAAATAANTSASTTATTSASATKLLSPPPARTHGSHFDSLPISSAASTDSSFTGSGIGTGSTSTATTVRTRPQRTYSGASASLSGTDEGSTESTIAPLRSSPPRSNRSITSPLIFHNRKDASPITAHHHHHHHMVATAQAAPSASASSTSTTSAPPPTSPWFYCIQNQYWDDLESMLRSYDPKEYPTEEKHSKLDILQQKEAKRKKKRRRQLRVAKFVQKLMKRNDHSSESDGSRTSSAADDEGSNSSSNTSNKNNNNGIHISPLLHVEPETGRTPLHCACWQPVPNKLIQKLLFVARLAASKVDTAGKQYPLHMAFQSGRRNIDLLDKLIKAYPPASWELDAYGKTPLLWAVDNAIFNIEYGSNSNNNKGDINNGGDASHSESIIDNINITGPKPSPPPYCFWGFPHYPHHQEWQQRQEQRFAIVKWLLENRIARNQPLLLEELLPTLLECLQSAAPPSVIRLALKLSMKHLMEPIPQSSPNQQQQQQQPVLAGPILSYLISRQYPKDLWMTVLGACPVSFLKTYKDPMGRGIVASHYRVACVVHDLPEQQRRQLKRHQRQRQRRLRKRGADRRRALLAKAKAGGQSSFQTSTSSLLSASSISTSSSIHSTATDDDDDDDDADGNANDYDSDNDDNGSDEEGTSRTSSSYRATLQEWALAKERHDIDYSPPTPFLEWWDKLKLLLQYWATHEPPAAKLVTFQGGENDNGGNDGNDDDDMTVANADLRLSDETHEELLMVHSALTNSDIPPSLLLLLVALYPNATELPHPKTQALPIHLACRVWRYRTVPPRKGEAHEVLLLNNFCNQLIEGDPARRTNKARYRRRLPIHHAVAAGKTWNFIQPLVEASPNASLLHRDPNSKLYPFQMAATPEVTVDIEVLTKQAFSDYEWGTVMSPDDQDRAMDVVEAVIELEQCTLCFELLRANPDAINQQRKESEKLVQRMSLTPKRSKSKTIAAEDTMASALQTKYVQGLFHLGHVSAHYIGWAYDTNARGWKVHRCNLAIIKEAIMDGFVSKRLHRWWHRLKFWIWQECRIAVPRRDEFLLHAAVSNPDTPLYVVNLILEIFPRSASIPICQSCYPLHIAMNTPKYLPLPFEFPHPKTTIEMILHAFPEAAMKRWDDAKLPLHVGIDAGKGWEELKAVAEKEPGVLSIKHDDLYPFQSMAINRPYSQEERYRLKESVRNHVTAPKWRKLLPHERALELGKALEGHELSVLTSVYELLRRNPLLLCLGTDFMAIPPAMQRGLDMAGTNHGPRRRRKPAKKKSWMNQMDSELSLHSLDFLEEVYEMDSSKLQSMSLEEAFGNGSFASDGGGSITPHGIMNNNSASSGSISLGLGGGGGGSRHLRQSSSSPDNSLSRFDQSMSLEQLAPGASSRDDSLTLTELSHLPWANSLARAQWRRQSLTGSYHSRGSSSPNSSIRSDQSFSLDQLIPRTFSRDDSTVSESMGPSRRRLSSGDFDSSDQSISLEGLMDTTPSRRRSLRSSSHHRSKTSSSSYAAMNDSVGFAGKHSHAIYRRNQVVKKRNAESTNEAANDVIEERFKEDSDEDFDDDFEETEYEEMDPNFASQFEFDFEERDPNFSSEEEDLEYEEKDPNFSSEDEGEEIEQEDPSSDEWEYEEDVDDNDDDAVNDDDDNEDEQEQECVDGIKNNSGGNNGLLEEERKDLDDDNSHAASDSDDDEESSKMVAVNAAAGIGSVESDDEVEGYDGEASINWNHASQLFMIPSEDGSAISGGSGNSNSDSNNSIDKNDLGGISNTTKEDVLKASMDVIENAVHDVDNQLSQSRLDELDASLVLSEAAVSIGHDEHESMTMSIPHEGHATGDFMFDHQRSMNFGDATGLGNIGMYAKDYGEVEHLERLDTNLKHVVIITAREAFIITRDKLKTLKASIFQRNHKKSWLRVLQNYGSQLNVKGLYTLRQDQDQQLVSIAMINKDMVVIDEDEDYIWVMNGIVAANHVENFDVLKTMEAVRYFETKGEIETWLDIFQKPELASYTFQESENSAIVRWLTRIFTMEACDEFRPTTTHRRFTLTPSILRSSMKHYEMGSQCERLPLDKQLAFALDRQRLATALRSRRRIPVKFQMPRARRYDVARKATVRMLERDRVLEVLKVKQLTASGVKCKLKSKKESRRLRIEVQRLPVPYRMTTQRNPEFLRSATKAERKRRSKERRELSVSTLDNMLASSSAGIEMISFLQSMSQEGGESPKLMGVSLEKIPSQLSDLTDTSDQIASQQRANSDSNISNIGTANDNITRTAIPGPPPIMTDFPLDGGIDCATINVESPTMLMKKEVPEKPIADTPVVRSRKQIKKKVSMKTLTMIDDPPSLVSECKEEEGEEDHSDSSGNFEADQKTTTRVIIEISSSDSDSAIGKAFDGSSDLNDDSLLVSRDSFSRKQVPKNSVAVRIPSHLQGLNQPKPRVSPATGNPEDIDDDSSLSHHELFDSQSPNLSPSQQKMTSRHKNPWLAAVLKAKRARK